jgi:hypothetical protein
MSKYDAKAVVENVVAEAMKAQDAFVQNITALNARPDVDVDQVTEGRNARTRIAIWAELKGIRTALTEIAQIMADAKSNPPA